MLNTYEFSILRMKLNAGDQVDAGRAIYTLVRHIERLEEELAQVKKEVEELKAKA